MGGMLGLITVGLGPPICMKCRVMYTYKGSYGWECPICETNDENQKGYLFECGISEEELDANLRFLLFMKGIDIDKKDDR